MQEYATTMGDLFIKIFLDDVKGIHKNVFIKCNVTLGPKAFLNVFIFAEDFVF